MNVDQRLPVGPEKQLWIQHFFYVFKGREIINQSFTPEGVQIVQIIFINKGNVSGFYRHPIVVGMDDKPFLVPGHGSRRIHKILDQLLQVQHRCGTGPHLLPYFFNGLL
jgi:hypothetical protein